MHATAGQASPCAGGGGETQAGQQCNGSHRPSLYRQTASDHAANADKPTQSHPYHLGQQLGLANRASGAMHAMNAAGRNLGATNSGMRREPWWIENGKQHAWRAWNMTHETLLTWPRSVSTSHAFVSATPAATMRARKPMRALTHGACLGQAIVRATFGQPHPSSPDSAKSIAGSLLGLAQHRLICS